jgi:hypothetical protein
MARESYILTCQLLLVSIYLLETSLVSDFPDPKTSHHSAPSGRTRLSIPVYARDTIEAELWCTYADHHSLAVHCVFVGKGYISTIRRRICQNQVPTSTLYNITNTHTHYICIIAASHHEDQHPMDDRIRHLCHCIHFAQ